MTLSRGSRPGRKQSLREQIGEMFREYTLPVVLFAIFTFLNAHIVNNANRAIDRADRQAEANYKIGILEGKMQILLEQTESKETKSKLTVPDSTSSPLIKRDSQE